MNTSKMIVIKPSTSSQFCALMVILEKDGYRWCTDIKPTEYGNFDKYGIHTHIYLYLDNKKVLWDNGDWARHNSLTVITLGEYIEQTRKLLVPYPVPSTSVVNLNHKIVKALKEMQDNMGS
jgi:hypothetical protein